MKERKNKASKKGRIEESKQGMKGGRKESSKRNGIKCLR